MTKWISAVAFALIAMPTTAGRTTEEFGSVGAGGGGITFSIVTSESGKKHVQLYVHDEYVVRSVLLTLSATQMDSLANLAERVNKQAFQPD